MWPLVSPELGAPAAGRTDVWFSQGGLTLLEAGADARAMDQVSRPLLIALVAVVAFLGLWMVALRPHGGSGSPAPAKPAAQVYAPLLTPHAAPARRAARHRAPASRAASQAAPAPRPAAVRPASKSRMDPVQRALLGGKVVALLFYNPSAADDEAVKQELASLTSAGGMVFTQAIPLSQASRYAQLTNQVPVNVSPTLVIVDRARRAQQIVGFADTFEIIQRLNDALAVPPAQQAVPPAQG